MRLRPERGRRPAGRRRSRRGGRLRGARGAARGAPGRARRRSRSLAGAARPRSPDGLRALLTSPGPGARRRSGAVHRVDADVRRVGRLTPVAVAGLALGVAPRVPLLLAAALMASSVAGHVAAARGLAGGNRARRQAGSTRARAGHGPGRCTSRARPASRLLGSRRTRPARPPGAARASGSAGRARCSRGMAVGAAVGRVPVRPAVLAGAAPHAERGADVRHRRSAVALGRADTGRSPAMAVGLARWHGVLSRVRCSPATSSLREALPPRVLAAGYSVMYAAAGAGYAASGIPRRAACSSVVAPSTAILAGRGD